MKRTLIIVFTTFTLLFFVTTRNCYSQIPDNGEANLATPVPLPIQSPQVSSLFNVSKPGLDLYRGQVSINVPIYSIKLKTQTFPIGLQYTAKGIKPNQQPGWLGANWTLQAGGVIRLEVKGSYDYNTNYTPIDPTQIESFDKYFNESQTDLTLMRKATDFTKDQYSFHFNGYSGKFYFDRTNKIYCSNPELKVEVGDGALLGEAGANENVGLLYGYNNTIFKITAKDGTMYFFGGVYRDRIKYVHENVINPIAWHLFKIITPLNEHVNFDYTLNESTNANINFGVNRYYTQHPYYGTTVIELSKCATILVGSIYNVLRDTTKWQNNSRSGQSYAIEKTWFENNPNADIISIEDPQLSVFPNASLEFNDRTPIESNLGYYTLKTITTPYEAVEFNKGDQYFDVLDPVDFSYFLPNSTETDRSRQLTLGNIKIYDKNKYTGDTTGYFRKFNLTYDTYAYALTKVQEFNASGQSIEPYTFQYYHPELAREVISITGAIDHWGYYNAMDREGLGILKSSLLPVFDNKFVHREPLAIVLKNTQQSGETNLEEIKKTYLETGMLKKVIYPTKGSTTFEYEQNDFSGMVYRDDTVKVTNQVVDLNGGNIPAGGIKVTKIIDESGSGNITKKEYKYINDYLKISGDTTSNHYTINPDVKSSGTIASNENYYMTFPVGALGYNLIDINASSSNCMPSDYIGYSEVAEIINDSLVTINKYSDFKTNPDVNPSRTSAFLFTFHSSDSPFYETWERVNQGSVYKQNQQESHEQERGKLLKIIKFKKNQGNYSAAEETAFKYHYVDSVNNYLDIHQTNFIHRYNDRYYKLVKVQVSGQEIIQEDWGDTYAYTAATIRDGQSGPYTYDHNAYVLFDKTKCIFGDYVNYQTTNKVYNGNNSNNYIKTNTNISHSKYSQIIEKEMINSDGVLLKTTNEYSENYGGAPWQNTLFKKHMVGVPYLFTKSKGEGYDKEISTQELIVYDTINSIGFPLPKVFEEYRPTYGITEPVMYFDNYSSDGNLLQTHKANDNYTSYIWSEGDLGGGAIVNGFDGDNLLYGIFGNAAEPINPRNYYNNNVLELQHDNIHARTTVHFTIPVLFLTGEEGSSFKFSMDYRYNKNYCPKSFSIDLGYNDQSVADIMRTQQPSNNALYDPPYLYPIDNIHFETTNNSDKNWTHIEKPITITYDRKSKYVYLSISSDAYTDTTGSGTFRIYIDNIKITPIVTPTNGPNSNGKYLLAKVENARHDDITYAISEDSGEIKLSSINVSTPNALVTRYTYDPVFGIRSVIDPNGKTTYYEYDTFGRLKLVRDNDGKIIKKYDYHYSNVSNP